MQFETSGYWKPKAYNHEGVPSLQELHELLKALKTRVSLSTYLLFQGLARTPPQERVARALQTAINSLLENTSALSSHYATSAEVFSSVLTAEEYASFVEIAGNGGLRQVHKKTAEDLLCLKDRGTLAHFLSKTFTSLHNKPYIHPLDNQEES